MPNTLNHFYEFGTFRLDPMRRLLLKDGEVVTLTAKVFDTLLVLVNSGGRVLEKNELMREVWADSIVEEGGLAKNISVLRKALGESPDQHRFIVTVPGRGYRFVADVSTTATEAASTNSATQFLESRREPTAEPASELGRSEGRRWRSRRVVPALALTVVLVLAVAFGWVWHAHSGPALHRQDTVVLADFTNRTGEIVFDEALKDGLAVQLEQSPFLNIFPESRVEATLRLMSLPADQPVTRDIARQICERQGAKAFIVGSIAALGTHYVISLAAVDGHSGETLARGQVEAERKENVLEALSKAAARLRGKLGESLGSIQKYDALLEVTTPSLEALKVYSLGDLARRRAAWEDATALYRRATELDPNFSYAYAALASIYRNRHQRKLATECAAKAYALRDRASIRERLLITSFYYEYVTGELNKQIENLRLYNETYPRDPVAHTNLALSYAAVGRLDEAVEESRIAMKLDPNSANRYSNLGSELLRRGQFAGALDIFRQAVSRKLDDRAVHHGLFRIAFINGDRAGMDSELKHVGRYEALEWQSEITAAAGKWRLSNEFARRATEAATQAGATETAATYAAEAALRAATLGVCNGTGALVPQALQAERNQLSLSRATLALSLCGQTGNSLRLADELHRSYPSDDLVNGIWLPVFRAAEKLQHGDAASAVQLLEPALQYEPSAYFWPQYLRGKAYLQMGKSAEALAEFRNIRDHRGQYVPSVIYPLAQLERARASALAGNVAGARSAYDVFLAEWSQADSDSPQLAAALKERAGLK